MFRTRGVSIVPVRRSQRTHSFTVSAPRAGRWGELGYRVNGPRIVVMQLASSKQVKRWRDHCLTALGAGAGAGDADPVDNRVVWQLSSANHRPLARSIRVHASFEEAAEDVHAARAQIDLIRHRALKISSRSEYVWVGTIDGANVLMSARTYSTVRDARDSIVVAAEAFSVATLSSGSRVVTRGAS